jgi:tetratricopeptide (TPR) repeat protein
MQLFAEPDLRCLRCGSPTPPEDISPTPSESGSPIPQESQSASPTRQESTSCPACGFTLTGVRLYNPKDFVWLGLLFSALFPIFMAGANWGKLGRTRTKWLCLGSGLLGFACVFGFLHFLPQAAWFMLMVNAPLALLLRHQQGSTYYEALRSGAIRASIGKGLFGGLTMTVCAVVLPLASFFAVSSIEFNAGYGLMEEQMYEKAATRFKRSLDWNPNADGALFHLAVCHMFLERWDEGAAGFERYLKTNPNNPAALGFLAYIRHRQGRNLEAEALAAKAKAVDPQIMEKLFGPNHEVPSGPPRSARAAPGEDEAARPPTRSFHPQDPVAL